MVQTKAYISNDIECSYITVSSKHPKHISTNSVFSIYRINIVFKLNKY